MKASTLVIVSLTLLLSTLTLDAETHVVMDTSEATAVLSILEKRTAGDPIMESDWTRLFESEPYMRLKKREAAMKRDFTDEEFRAFVMSDDLAKAGPALRTTLDSWSKVDLDEPIAKASAYLKDGSTIRAKIYPVIKPKTNSFVFELSTDPAIFMYLDPTVAPDKLSNTLAHELHHIGFGVHCPSPEVEAEIDALPPALSWTVARLAAFGEGFAMLAAAGGPDVHPHETSDAADRERWDRDIANAEADLRKVERFVVDSIEGRLVGEERQQTFFSFYGVQGPWYTIGWVMSSTIEKELRRAELINAFCDPRLLLATYNRAAKLHNERSDSKLPLWSDEALSAVRGESIR